MIYDYELPLWIGPLLALLCIGLKAGITLLMRAREEKKTSQAEVSNTKPVDSTGEHVRSQTAVRLLTRCGCCLMSTHSCSGCLQRVSKPSTHQCNGKSSDCSCAQKPFTAAAPTSLPGKVLYASQKGTAAAFAKQIVRHAVGVGVELQAVNLKDYEVEQLWKEHLILLVVSTYENGSPPEPARYFSLTALCSSACSKILVHLLQ